jgi:hypothetical protein
MGHQSSRRWDATPETSRDRKCFDLRESGYTGPIDSNGNAVTTGPDAETLRRTALARGEEVTW